MHNRRKFLDTKVAKHRGEGIEYMTDATNTNTPQNTRSQQTS